MDWDTLDTVTDHLERAQKGIAKLLEGPDISDDAALDLIVAMTKAGDAFDLLSDAHDKILDAAAEEE